MSHNQSNVREIIKMLVILGSPYSIQNNVMSRSTINTNLTSFQRHNKMSPTEKLEPMGIQKPFKYYANKSFFKYIENSKFKSAI